MALRATLGTFLMASLSAHGSADAGNPSSTKTTAAVAPYSVNDECFSKAYAAAHRVYRNHYENDWYVQMRAVVHNDRVARVELNVGPYDGSVGGGIAAQYDCSDGRLETLEYER